MEHGATKMMWLVPPLFNNARRAMAAMIPSGGPADPNQCPSTDWKDEPESSDVRAALAVRVGEQQAKAARGCPASDGRVGRGQHQKQLLGAWGALRIYDSIPQEARSGAFGTPGTFVGACRFSNGQPCAFKDQLPDVRGVAVKFFTPDDVETDLVATNEGGRSHARNALEFMNTAELLLDVDIRGGKIQAIKDLVGQLVRRQVGPISGAHVATILTKETVLRRVSTMTAEAFWGSVVQLGDYAIKYSLQPDTAVNPGTDADPKKSDYLRQDLLNRIAKKPVRYRLCVQFFSDERRTPVNDASKAWKAPLVEIGDLQIQSLPSPEEEELIASMAFNPGRGFDPLGITHARRDVYAASARNRGALEGHDVRPVFATNESLT
jgi:catalase